MIAGHVEERNVQQRDNVCKIRVRQVTTSNDQFDIVEMTTVAKTIEPFNDLITGCKDFHCADILPQKEVPCKVFTMKLGGN